MMRVSRVLGRSSAFTLVELLVTVGIIAILIAVLVPALNAARKQAHAARCLSNQRTIMQAMISYAGDNDGYLPPPNWDGGVAVTVNPATKARSPNFPNGWLYDPAQTSGGHFQQTDAQTGQLYPYINSLQTYRCYIDDGNWGANTVQVVTSYMMNGAVCNYKDDTNPEKLRSFKSSSILLWEIPIDQGNDSGLVNDGADWPAEGITTRHSNGSTVGFVDGHAELWSWTQFASEWYYHYPGMLWCAPKYGDGGQSTWTSSGHGWPSAPLPQPANGG